jgi:hypothetical protein
MPLWCFLFADPGHPIASARVAAPDRNWAAALLSEAAQFDVATVSGVVVQCIGAMTCEASVIECLARGVPR